MFIFAPCELDQIAADLRRLITGSVARNVSHFPGKRTTLRADAVPGSMLAGLAGRNRFCYGTITTASLLFLALFAGLFARGWWAF